MKPYAALKELGLDLHAWSLDALVQVNQIHHWSYGAIMLWQKTHEGRSTPKIPPGTP